MGEHAVEKAPEIFGVMILGNSNCAETTKRDERARHVVLLPFYVTDVLGREADW